jgi:hypothetical protein
MKKSAQKKAKTWKKPLLCSAVTDDLQSTVLGSFIDPFIVSKGNMNQNW